MKKIYSKPETEIIDIEPQQMICTSPGIDEPKPESDEWFDIPSADEGTKFKGALD
ncbi:MAG: hypothetical protein J6K19_03155 [Prevotella sp.]|nr:hypothetical protein [Prevotella sp.]